MDALTTGERELFRQRHLFVELGLKVTAGRGFFFYRGSELWFNGGMGKDDFTTRDKVCYGIVAVGVLAIIGLLFSGRWDVENLLAGNLLTFLVSYALARGHIRISSRQMDSDEKKDHPA